MLRPIAEQIGAELILVTGESSDTYIADSCKRASEDQPGNDAVTHVTHFPYIFPSAVSSWGFI